MATLAYTSIDDLVNSGRRHAKRPGFVDIASELTAYVGWKNLVQGRKLTVGNSYGYEWQLMVNLPDSAKFAGAYEEDVTAVITLMANARVDYTRLTVNWSYDESEHALNQGMEKINDLVVERRTAALINQVEVAEGAFWDRPSGPSDTLPIFGMKYWVVRHTTGTSDGDGGFNGTDPGSLFTTIGNVNPTTYPQHANFTRKYTNVTDDDLVAGMRRAQYETNFQAPVRHPDVKYGPGKGIYTTYDTYTGLDVLSRQQNDNLGRDLAAGEPLFKRIPITPVPWLTENDATDDPVYMIDWAYFRPVFKPKWWMREMGPIVAPKQHLVKNVFVDTMLQVVCTKRRAQSVLSKGTTNV